MIKPDDLVLIEHPYMTDRHVVAQIVAISTAMCELRYWTRRGWAEETKRRKRAAIMGKLPPGSDPATTLDALDRANTDRDAAIKAAEDTYRTAMRSLLAPVDEP